jgi:predicted RNase H-like HicB family nuclease
MKYKVHLLRTDGGYAVWVPGLPGCYAQGRTKEEALENVRSAIISYLDAIEEDQCDLESCLIEI